MGTRCLTKVYDEQGHMLINMYRQFDGYPTGHGAELAEFLNNGRMVNGLIMTKTPQELVFNGAGCLAAQLVAHFKQEPGGFYLYPTNIEDCGQDFEYHIYTDGGISIKIMNCGVNFFGMTQSDTYESVFDGNLAQFTKFCANKKVEEIPLDDNFVDSKDAREALKAELTKGAVTVVFKKQDGTERMMNCTLSDDVVPLLDTTGVKQKRTPNADVLAVWDIDNNGWRSFRYDSVIYTTVPSVA